MRRRRRRLGSAPPEHESRAAGAWDDAETSAKGAGESSLRGNCGIALSKLATAIWNEGRATAETRASNRDFSREWQSAAKAINAAKDAFRTYCTKRG